MKKKYLEAGQIVSTHGVQGEVKILPWCDGPEFLKDFDTFYIDGREDGHIGQYISHRPEFLLISTEPMGYRMKAHQPTAQAQAAIGDTFLVDYVRVFDPVEE